MACGGALPQDLQKTLQVFDVDGDGTRGTAELARAAGVQDSKNMVKRLAKAVGGFFCSWLHLLACGGLTAHVIESAKETETSGDGITFVKGSDQPGDVWSRATTRSVVAHFCPKILMI